MSFIYPELPYLFTFGSLATITTASTTWTREAAITIESPLPMFKEVLTAKLKRSLGVRGHLIDPTHASPMDIHRALSMSHDLGDFICDGPVFEYPTDDPEEIGDDPRPSDDDSDDDDEAE